ncbi:CD99 antigen-like protein 2 isoform X12 [Scyliorhinus torazame]|uniref:CD99 antigen-like protein 2 isoform X12 n=1 Tax=Scyliorhinus torazame TaxID=75743 RepID=UPI003B5A2F96
MANALRVVLLCATFTLLTGGVLGDDGFDLSDALSDDHTTKPPPAKPRNPSGGKDTDDFSLWDILPTTPSPRKTTKSPKTPKKPQKGNSDDPSVPGSKRNGKPKGGKKTGAADLSDKDLEDLLDGGYKPDGKKQGDNIPSDDQDQVAMPETTIAGIASAVAAALLGVVSSYIAYQKKQLCFKIQEGFNVKGENAEAGKMAAPQAEQSLLQTQSEKPPADIANQI